MQSLKTSFREPINYIKNRPLHFSVWIFVVVVFGLAGVWMPCIFEYLKYGTGEATLLNQIKAGSLASFGVVILADGLATILTSVNSGKNITTAGIRGVVGTFAIFLIVINVAILSLSDPSVVKISSAYIVFQLSILLLTIAIAIYLYCFRTNDWEKTVDSVIAEENEQVEKLIVAAVLQNHDDNGVKL